MPAPPESPAKRPRKCPQRLESFWVETSYPISTCCPKIQGTSKRFRPLTEFQGLQFVDSWASRLRRFFQSSLLHITYDLRKRKAVKPLATIHPALRASKRQIYRFDARNWVCRVSEPTRFHPRDKNGTTGSRFRNSLRICLRFCPKRLREDTRRSSAARRSRLTTQLESTGMSPRQTGVKERGIANIFDC